MKKLLLFTMVAMFAFTLTGCGTKDSAPTENLINWTQGGTYFMKYTSEAEYGGQKITAKGSMAVQGDNMAINTETTAEGQTMKSRMIMKDNFAYMIDDANKMTMKMPINKGQTANKGAPDYSKLEKIGSGKGEINGKILPYQEYKSENFTVKYYMEGKKVYAIENKSEGGKSVMIIEDASKTIPDGSFDLPKDYKTFGV